MYGPTCAGIYTKRRNNPYAIAPDFAPRAFKSQQPVKKITRAGYNFASSKKEKKKLIKSKRRTLAVTIAEPPGTLRKCQTGKLMEPTTTTRKEKEPEK
jgi:hypothetical protein